MFPAIRGLGPRVAVGDRAKAWDMFGQDRRKSVPKPAPKRLSPLEELEQKIDPLTGVKTQRAIEAEALRACEAATNESRMAVACIAIEGLVEIRQVHGKLTTDLVLREVAERLKKTIRSYDSVGRYGSFDFMIVFQNMAQKVESLVLISRLRVKLAEPLNAGAFHGNVDAFCGVAHFPGDGADAHALIQAAARSMDEKKVAELGELQPGDVVVE